jgi:hypothetical protein
MLIKKKLLPEYFDDLVSNRKKYDLRLGDWLCQAGDILIFQEWDPKKEKYTGREIRKKVTYVRTFKLDHLYWPKKDIEKYGLMIISIK